MQTIINGHREPDKLARKTERSEPKERDGGGVHVHSLYTMMGRTRRV
jgi:hypothetical protein